MTTIARPAPTEESIARTTSWRWKNAAVVTTWIGGSIALFVTVAVAATGGISASRFNTLGTIGAALVLGLAAGFGAMSVKTRPERVYYDVTEVDENDEV